MNQEEIKEDFIKLEEEKGVSTGINGPDQENVASVANMDQIYSIYNVNYSINSISDSNQIIQSIPPPPQVQILGPTLIGPMPIGIYPYPIYSICNCQQIRYVPQPMPIPQKIAPDYASVPLKRKSKLVPIAPNLQKSGLDVLSDVATNERGGADYRIDARIRYEICSTCNKTKPISQFTLRSSGERTHTCEICSARKRNYYQRVSSIKRQRKS